MMPLMQFSEQDHIKKLLDGRKQQTTRLPRKNPIKKGDALYCYFKPRMKKGTCKNCINQECKRPKMHEYGVYPEDPCPRWTNHFGTATVTHVSRVKFKDMDLEELKRWSYMDGFPNLGIAKAWFAKAHGDNWQEAEFDIIYFKPDWLYLTTKTCNYCINGGGMGCAACTLPSDGKCKLYAPITLEEINDRIEAGVC